MSKEAYLEIKRISGEELKELLSDLDNVFDLGTETLMGDNSTSAKDWLFSYYFTQRFILYSRLKI